MTVYIFMYYVFIKSILWFLIEHLLQIVHVKDNCKRLSFEFCFIAKHINLILKRLRKINPGKMNSEMPVISVYENIYLKCRKCLEIPQYSFEVQR